MSTTTHHCLFTDDVRVEARQHPDIPDAVAVVLYAPHGNATLTLSPAQWRDVVEAVLPHLSAVTTRV